DVASLLSLVCLSSKHGTCRHVPRQNTPHKLLYDNRLSPQSPTIKHTELKPKCLREVTVAQDDWTPAPLRFVARSVLPSWRAAHAPHIGGVVSAVGAGRFATSSERPRVPVMTGASGIISNASMGREPRRCRMSPSELW